YNGSCSRSRTAGTGSIKQQIGKNRGKPAACCNDFFYGRCTCTATFYFIYIAERFVERFKRRTYLFLVRWFAGSILCFGNHLFLSKNRSRFCIWSDYSGATWNFDVVGTLPDSRCKTPCHKFWKDCRIDVDHFRCLPD